MPNLNLNPIRTEIEIRLHCYFCNKPVSSIVPSETIVRAAVICPECIEQGRIEIPELEETSPSEDFNK